MVFKSNGAAMIKKFIRKLIDVEIKLGFFNIPAAGIEMMSDVMGGNPVST